MENLKTPEDYIGAVLERVKPEYLVRHFGIDQWSDANDFLEKLARFARDSYIELCDYPLTLICTGFIQ